MTSAALIAAFACGASTTSGSGCSGLSACCGGLPAASQPSCDAVVNAGNATVCEAELAELQCSRSGTGTGSATATMTTNTSAEGCAGLSACCSTLEGQAQASCEGVLAQDPSACAAQLSLFIEAGTCN